MLPLKPLSKDAVPAALAKAERYRLLNEPGQAESICLDVLAIDPDNQQALVTLVLSLTDQFAEHRAGSVQRAQEFASRLAGEYERTYYAGIICERRAKAQLLHAGHGASSAAREWLKEALDHFERAEGLRPPGNDDAILRWNSCVRLLQQHPEVTAIDDGDARLMMLE